MNGLLGMSQSHQVIFDVWNDWASTVAAVGAVIAAVVAIVIAVQLSQRERRQALASVHVDLTRGETAKARDLIGSVLYSKRGIKAVDPQSAIAALFRLYWAVQRLENVYRVYRIKPNAQRSRRLHETYMSYNFNDVVKNLVQFRQTYGAKLGVSDDEAWELFREGLKFEFPDVYREVFQAKPVPMAAKDSPA